MTPDAKHVTSGDSRRAARGPTVSARFARALLDFAVSRGAGRETMLEQAGLAASILADDDARLPFAGYVDLMRAAKAVTGDPALALHYGEGVDIARVSIVGLIGQASPTMMDALVQLNRYVRLIVETANAGGGDRFQLRRDTDGLWMVDAREDADAFPELTESAFAQLVCRPRQLGLPPLARRVRVTWSDPGYGGEYERVLGAPVAFDSDRNGLLLNPASVGAPVEALPTYVFGVLTGHADAQLRALDRGQTVRSRVEDALKPVLHTGRATMEVAAAALGISRQTLFRRLKAEGVTFETVLDELRRDLALRYLDGGAVSVTETAYLVGYSEPAAFSRAFRRWTGERPRARRSARG